MPRFRGNWLGGWSQSGTTRERHYIDPSITPSPGAYALLGWLLDGDYTAGPAEREVVQLKFLQKSNQEQMEKLRAAVVTLRNIGHMMQGYND